jgi:hypothetical protein
MLSEYLDGTTTAIKEAIPNVVGLANDAFSAVRGGTVAAAEIGQGVLFSAAFANNVIARSVGVAIEKNSMNLERDIIAKEYSLEAVQLAYEVEQKYREMTGMLSSINLAGASYQQANERVRAVLAKGLRVLQEREAFRKRAAAVAGKEVALPAGKRDRYGRVLGKLMLDGRELSWTDIRMQRNPDCPVCTSHRKA